MLMVAMPFCARRAKEEPAVSTWPPSGLRFSESHVWARIEGDMVTIGLTDFGQQSFGDILCLELPKPGDKVAKGSGAAWADTYRRAFDIVSPVTGDIVELNQELAKHPGQINAYPYASPGILKLRVRSPAEYEAMMDFGQYTDWVRRLRQYDAWSSDLRMT